MNDQTQKPNSIVPDPAATMEAEECALIKEERIGQKEYDREVHREAEIARAADLPDMRPQGEIEPEVSVHTDRLSQQHRRLTPSDTMEAEEKALIKDERAADKEKKGS